MLFDLHSFPTAPLPYELHQSDRRPQICLGVDERHTPDWLLAAAQKAFRGFDVEVDQPFRGTYVPSRHHGSDLRVSSLMIEVRRDLPPDSPAAARCVARLVAAVGAQPPHS